MKQVPKSGKVSISLSDYGLLGVLVLTAVYGLVATLMMHQEVERVIILWLFAVGMAGATAWRRIKNHTFINPHDLILSWIFLICAFGALLLTAFFSNELALQISLLFLFGAFLARFANYPDVFKLLPAGAVLLILLPNADYFNSLMSYPLRLICSHITCFLLSASGMQISCDATVLTLGREEIAVTAACSGINQLEAMFFIGWLITMLVHKRLICRVSHWLLLLPLVILFNALRLIITLIIYSNWGEVALSDTVHSVLGYLMVIAVAVTFYLCSSLIPFAEKQQTGEDSK
jgi:exosortase/archaeosortase family protein